MVSNRLGGKYRKRNDLPNSYPLLVAELGLEPQALDS